jgi:hypothetical protein
VGIALASLWLPAYAQSSALAPPFSDVHTIATAATGVPVEEEINIAAPGQYQVTLTDLGALLTPSAPLASVKLAVTSGSAQIGTTLSGAGVLQFTAGSAGTYVVRVVGTPGTQAGSGPIGIEVGTAADPASLYSFSDTLALPSAALPNGEAVIDGTFTLSGASGTYTVSLSDFHLPDALSIATLILIQTGGTQPLAILPDPNTQATQASVNLQNGTSYRILAASLPGASGAGLMAATVAAGDGSIVFGKAAAVGATQLAGSPALAAGAHSARLADLAYPLALSQLAGVVTLSGVAVANLTPGSTQSFNAVAGTYQVFVAAVAPTAAPAAGSYSLLVQPASGAADLSVARLVSSPSSTAAAYSFDTQVGSAGSYVAQLTNFAFPVSLTSLRLAAVQNGAVLGAPLSAAGSLSITPAAGALTFLVLAQADPAQGGVFDVNLTASGSTVPVFDATQGVVGTNLSFLARKVTVDTSGKYSLQLSDVGFPANFSNIAALVSQGGTSLGTIFGADQLVFTASPGDYFISLIAQPAGADHAGTYALSMQPAALPTLTLASSASTVSSGGNVTLTWSSQNTTSCTASGGWTGTQAVSGSLPSAALSATTVFTLSCDGPAGTVSQSVTVTVNTPSGGGGGGGASDATLLALLIGAVAAARLRRRFPA